MIFSGFFFDKQDSTFDLQCHKNSKTDVIMDSAKLIEL